MVISLLQKSRRSSTIKNKNYKPRKPDSVFTLSFICDVHCCTPVAAYPEARAGSAQSLLYSALQHPGFTQSMHYCHALVSSYLTFSPSSRNCAGQLFSVALSRGASACPDVIRIDCPSLSGLSLPPLRGTIVRACSNANIEEDFFGTRELNIYKLYLRRTLVHSVILFSNSF